MDSKQKNDVVSNNNSTIKNLATKSKKICSWIFKNRYSIFYCIVFICLTTYIILNWQSCISMQFFSEFNGNNILFIAWIIFIFLTIYDVEAKGTKFQRHKIEEDLESVIKNYNIELLSQHNNQQLNNVQRGECNNGSQNQNDDC